MFFSGFPLEVAALWLLSWPPDIMELTWFRLLLTRFAEPGDLSDWWNDFFLSWSRLSMAAD